jgi:hypothetical protein
MRVRINQHPEAKCYKLEILLDTTRDGMYRPDDLYFTTIVSDDDLDMVEAAIALARSSGKADLRSTK